VTLSLAEHLKQLIALEGPQPVSVLMDLALSHPREGYYAARPRVGADGDFVTAPEVSQMFGELVGAFVLQTWFDLGSPANWTLIELGPGNARLMEDVIRVLKLRTQATAGLGIQLVEASPVLTATQEEALANLHVRTEWRRSFAGAGDVPFVLLANEFFDALPIRQFVRHEGAWGERRVTIDAGGALQFGQTPTVFPVAAEVPAATNAANGDVVEISSAARSIARLVGDNLSHVPGRALIFDYGYANGTHGDTLQAVGEHRKVDVLTHLGQADLSAHVDFAALAREAADAGALAYGPMPQGAFLKRLGIEARHDALASRATEPQRAVLARQLHRLTGSDEMGDLFKVLALSSPNLPPPPGFEPSDG
jgi:NADH dehydrogenase [ubiquinone] 1 alpha subcomplex assembly factor 7